jgi:UMF1 family MFS transporter
MENKFRLTSLEKKWVLYDVGNSAFTLMVSTLIPIYFNSLAESDGLSSVSYLAYWGYAITLSTLIVVLLGPTIGAISDKQGMKKPLFLGSILAGAAGCLAMGMTKGYMAFLIIFVIARIGYQVSLVIYDSTLSDVTEEKRMDSVSSSGYAWGYIGSVVPFIVCLLLVLGSEKIGLSMGQAMTIAFCIVAVWWVAMSLPLMRSYVQKNYVNEAESESMIVKRLAGTLKDMYENRQVFLFVLAFFFYIDGVYTIIDMSTAYGTALGLNTTGLLLALLLTQFVAFPSALVMGRLSRSMRPEKLITICIAAYFCIAMFAVFMTSQIHFWILAVGVGLFQGGIQSLSRSYFTKIIPAEKSGEYFGFLDICGKGASMMGTLLMSAVTQITGRQQIGVGCIALLFIAGFFLFRASVAHASAARQ